MALILALRKECNFTMQEIEDLTIWQVTEIGKILKEQQDEMEAASNGQTRKSAGKVLNLNDPNQTDLLINQLKSAHEDIDPKKKLKDNLAKLGIQVEGQ